MQIKNVTVHAGHNKQGKVACGASDYLDESKECRYICRKVVKLLKKNKIKATNITVNNGTSQSDVLRTLVDRANDTVRSVDLHISLHMNACTHEIVDDGKSKGVEVCLIQADGKTMKEKVAKKICANISKLGFTNRGVKNRTDLYFLNKTFNPAILVEICFVDDATDARLYKKYKDDIAKAIVNAVIFYNRQMTLDV